LLVICCHNFIDYLINKIVATDYKQYYFLKHIHFYSAQRFSRVEVWALGNTLILGIIVLSHDLGQALAVGQMTSRLMVEGA